MFFPPRPPVLADTDEEPDKKHLHRKETNVSFDLDLLLKLKFELESKRKFGATFYLILYVILTTPSFPRISGFFLSVQTLFLLVQCNTYFRRTQQTLSAQACP